MSTTIYAPNLSACTRLEQLLTGYGTERTELIAAGVPARRVEALYPLDFDRMMNLAGEHFSVSGTDHLSDVAIPKAEWNEISNITYRMCAMEPELSRRYEAEWCAHYGPLAAELKFYQLTYSSLLNHHYLSEAITFTQCAGQAMFACYWLLRYPQLALLREDKAQQLMQWVAAKLLP